MKNKGVLPEKWQIADSPGAIAGGRTSGSSVNAKNC
jgi:hypothetical protein